MLAKSSSTHGLAVQKKPQTAVRSMPMSEEALAFVRMTTLLQMMRAVLRMFLFSRNLVRCSTDSSHSGWSVYTSALAGETPCYTTSSLALQAPNVTSTASGASVSVINTEIFTLRYALKQPQQSSLSTGATVGIAVGVSCAGIIALLALAIFIRKRRAQKRAQRDEANMPKPESGNMYQRGSIGAQTAVSELPSPQMIRSPTPRLPENALWYHMPLGSHAPGRAMTPTELIGSTYINEHHPAYGVSPVTPNVNGFHDVPGPPEELAGDDPMKGNVSREAAPAESRAELRGGSALKEESERSEGAG